jgi:hypothetical protein
MNGRMLTLQLGKPLLDWGGYMPRASQLVRNRARLAPGSLDCQLRALSVPPAAFFSSARENIHVL